MIPCNNELIENQMDKGKASQFLHVVPDSIFFRDINKNDKDIVELWIQNVGKKPVPMRLSVPKDSPFILSSCLIPMTAPGLEVKIEISYTAKTDSPVESELVIATDECSIAVPIKAFPPCPRILSDKSHIELGNVGIKSNFKFSFSLSNIGVEQGTFKLSSKEESLKIIPDEGPIFPGKSAEITCYFNPTKEGACKFEIDVEGIGAYEKCPPIEITATAVLHSLALLIDDKDVNELDFETIYFGQKRIISTTITNRGPFKQSFVVLPPRDSIETSTIPSGSSSSKNSVFTAVPSEGLLNPYCSTIVRFIFNPPLYQYEEEDHDYLFNQNATIEVVETGQKLDFQLMGKAVHHLVSLSSMDFTFDKTPLKQRSTLTLTLNNLSHFLPTHFDIKPIAHFRFEPSKGVIKPSKSVDITILFYPKNLGDIEVTSIITFSGGLAKKRVNLFGTCGDVEKQFKRIPIYETDEEVKFNAMHPDTRFAYDLTEIKKNEANRKRNDAFLFDAEEKRREKNKKKEINSRIKKDAESYLSHTLGTYTKEDVNEFIQTHLADDNYMKQFNDENNNSKMAENGLVPPDPPLRIKAEPLYLQNPEKFGLVSTVDDDKKKVNSRKKELLDENVLIKKKFKSKPTSPSEISDCNKALTPSQQLMVIASHQTINFGQVSVYSKNAKSFTIQNNMNQNILISMKYDYDELKESTPATQVIPPNQIGGFDIKFTSTLPQNFMKTIQYTVNGHHNYSVSVFAQVVPIDFEISKKSIDFKFSQDSMSPIITEFVKLTNKSNAVAEYEWTSLSPPFYIEQPKGSIEPSKTALVEIAYKPTTRNHDEEMITCEVKGGSPILVKLTGDVGNPKCSLQKKVINFGLIPVGIEKISTMKIKNSGDDDAIFTIQIPKSAPELRIMPMMGRIASRESLMLQVNYRSQSSHQFDIPVSISVCGAPTLTFNVIGQSELPDVQISTTAFEFGRVFVGSSGEIETSITNMSPIPAVLLLDLTNHPEFRIEFSKSDMESTENINAISLVSDQTFVTKMQDNSGDYRSSGQVAVSSNQEKGLCYKLNVLEHSEINFSLIFQPEQVGEHSFELPISMMNTSSSFPMMPIVSSEAIEAPIIMSTTAIDFSVRPVYDPQNVNCPPISHILRLHSAARDPINWRIDIKPEPSEDEEIFMITPNSGTLNQSESQSVKIQFYARKPIPYNSFLFLYVVSDDKLDNLIGKIQLTGIGSTEMFRPSMHEVCMPIVPINTKCQMDLHIENVGHVQTLLKIKMPVDESSFPVKVTFPEGNQLLYTTIKLPINITFQSNKPVSFTTIVAIMDEYGNATSFISTCTCDNSVFSLYSYLSNPHKPGKNAILTKEFLDNSELQSRFLMANDFLELNDQKWNNSFSQVVVDFFIRYLNALILSTQISSFPDDFIATDGSILFDAIVNLSGAKINDRSASGTSGNSRNEDPVNKRRSQFKQLIQLLQSMGGLLSSIRPEFLMNKSDFIHFMQIKITKQMLGIDYFGAPELSSFDQKVLNEYTSSQAFSKALVHRLKIVENIYEKLSIESWITVILQTIKLFMIARVDPEKLHLVAGYSDTVKQVKQILSKQSNGNEIFKDINRSVKQIPTNTATLHELALLKWISMHYIKMGGDVKRKFTNFSVLTDSVAFAYLTASHSNLFKANLNDKPKDKQQMETNAINFIAGLKNLKLSFIPKSNEIVDGFPCVLCSLAEYFYETLPHYLPSTVIEFNTSLHQPITRTISLTNPSKSEIMYHATIVGDSGFVFQYESIIVEPTKTVDFPIVFMAKSVRSATARVILIPNKPRDVYPKAEGSSASSTARSIAAPKRTPIYSAPIVVDLVATVSITGPAMSFNYETTLYSPKLITLPIKNLLESKSVNVLIKLIKITDENGKPLKNNNVVNDIVGFIQNPTEKIQKNELPPDNDLHHLIDYHTTFYSKVTNITFAGENAELEIDFLPIELCTYRCLILFQNPAEGEFVYEIIAKSTLPIPIDVNNNKFKVESSKSVTVPIPIELTNSALFKQLAYGVLKKTGLTDRRLTEMVTRKAHEFEADYRQKFTLSTFSVLTSATQYYEVPNEFVLQKAGQNSLNVTFKPTKAGDYPSKIVLLSHYDVRNYQIKGIGLPETKELSIEFQTSLGRTVHQEIPIVNPSDDVWQIKITLHGDPSFTAPTRINVKPKSQNVVPVSYYPNKIGTFNAEMNVFNITKEATTIYTLSAIVDEPPAEEKLVFDCQARSRSTQSFKVRPFIRNTELEVTSTIPVIEYQPKLMITDSDSMFTFDIYATRSGISAGTITFTDPQTKNYIWYIVELHIDTPPAEGTIDVNTTARKNINVPIPITNNNSFAINYQVSINDEDLHGPKEFIAPPNFTSHYNVLFEPVKAMKRISAVSFYSDEAGEFWYKLNINVDAPESQMLAPLTAPIGKTSSVFVTLENQFSKMATFRCSNDNVNAFQIMSKESFQLPSLEKKKIEIRYLPTCVGNKETATISFHSAEAGDYEFFLTGTGKPPQPLSPTIITASPDNSNSTLVLFTNPFPYPARFSVSLTSESDEVFEFLLKKKVFILNNYDEEFQIPFTFSPTHIGQYKGHIVVSSLGQARAPLPDLESLPSIRWVYPIIGNSTLLGANEKVQLRTKSQNPIAQTVSFTLVGETETFEMNEYSFILNIPSAYEFIRSILELRVDSIERLQNTTKLIVKAKFSPQRPFTQTITLTIRNPLGQEWQFPIDLNVELGSPQTTIVLESIINKTSSSKIQIPALFRENTPFHAYFAAGSASEFSLSDSHGMVEPSTTDVAELPVEIIFGPKMYGKILKGLLVVDTLDSQFLFDVVGKTPDYVPPVAKKSSIDTSSIKRGSSELSEKKLGESPKKKKRNIIKDNIDGIKITKPKIDQK